MGDGASGELLQMGARMRVVQTLLDPNMSLMLGKEPYELYYNNKVR